MAALIGSEIPGRGAVPQSEHFPLAPTGDPEWIIVEDGFTLTREHEVESLFAMRNGYVGSRASLAEGCALSAPATFGARGLAGTAYKGHVFSDTDIFMLPFFARTYPKAARALVL
jgi:trehalose/maltose hydrolase-like predicted phosphorylase